MSTNAKKINSSESPGIMKELLFAGVLVLVYYITLLSVQIIYNYINRMSMSRVPLLPYTYNTQDKSITISQNPNVVGSMPTALSDNERTGIEFSYSFYLLVNPSTFNGNFGLAHIFHKGYPKQFPLLAPGVYMRTDKNTLRVYMNTYKTWNNYVEVDNIPISKWVHIVIACKENSLEIYVNGNLTKKSPFDGYVPYQNYQDIICFSQRVLKLPTGEDKLTEPDRCYALANNVGSSVSDAFKQCTVQVSGVINAMLSRLDYFSYALCYAEIQTLMNTGTSSKVDPSTNTSNVPPYMDDTWWSQGY